MENYTFRIIIEPDRPVGYHGFVPLLRGKRTLKKQLSVMSKDWLKSLLKF